MSVNTATQYCLYLRKSRADVEAEMRGEGETLTRHQNKLLELAEYRGYPIGAVYKEIVTGESISARPVMQKLLAEVDAGIWHGVLVMEVERLARGDTKDQGIVAESFKYSNTLIITPLKTYDPGVESDEEYFEFGLFMSRREYNTIRRRLNNGRLASVKEGKYVGNTPPYGYRRVKLEHDKGYTLEPDPGQAEIVRLIFSLYTSGEHGERLGITKIARRLNELVIPAAKGGAWSAATIQTILKNPVYTGKICWNRRKQVKRIVAGTIIRTRPQAADYEICDGLHPAIISTADFELAQHLRSRNPPRPVSLNKVTQNPLSGLVFCSECGRSMVRRPYQAAAKPAALICPQPGCPTVSSSLELVERLLLMALAQLIGEYCLNTSVAAAADAHDVKQRLYKNRQLELSKLREQKNRLCDFLEQGIYTAEVFAERSALLISREQKLTAALARLAAELNQTELPTVNRLVSRQRSLLSYYGELTAAERNRFLKEIVLRIEYQKSTKSNSRGNHIAPFQLRLTTVMDQRTGPFGNGFDHRSPTD